MGVYVRRLSLMVVLLAPSLASAYTFVPTETEWLAWPKYCQVVYTRTNIGKMGGWSHRITRADEIAARSVLGNETFGGVGVHHYCAGSSLLGRALSERDPKRRTFLLGEAETNTAYTLQRAHSGHAMFAPAATQMANIMYEQGRLSEALALLERSIAEDPKNAPLYMAKAALHYKEGDFEASRRVLEAGDNNVGGESLDIQYTLGLIMIKLGQPESAMEYAARAYRKGYPLPGLKQQLQRSGYWTEPQ